MGLTGDFDKLSQVVGELKSVPHMMAPITRVAAGRVSSLFAADFTGQHDPWGNRWEPNKSGKTPVLFESGALANPKVTFSGGVVRVRPERYWIFHQAGAHGMAERAILPFGSSTPWDPPIQSAVNLFVRDHFRSSESE